MLTDYLHSELTEMWGYMISSILITIILLTIYLGWALILLPFIFILFSPIIATGIIGAFYIYRLTRTTLQGDTMIAHTQVVDDHTQLVSFADCFPELALQAKSLLKIDRIRGRQKVGEMLLRAQQRLSGNYKLMITKCYQPNMNDSVNTGHNTGGAIDVTLVDNSGVELDLGLRIPNKLNLLGRVAKTNLTERVRENRKILSTALSEVGFINNPTEWWHWSYGDKYWCAMTKASMAIYGEIPVQA